MWDIFVFGIDYEVVCKKCIMKGNDFIFEKVWDIVCIEEVI